MRFPWREPDPASARKSEVVVDRLDDIADRLEALTSELRDEIDRERRETM